MAANRASMSDGYLSTPDGDLRRAARAVDANPEAPRRIGMVVGGLLLAILSLAVAAIALMQIWGAPAVANGTAQASSTFASGEVLAMVLFGGLGLAGGAALVGIGMGRWNSPRRPVSDADYTGPGQDASDAPQPPRVV